MIKCVCTSNSFQMNSVGKLIPCCKYLNDNIPHINKFNNLFDYFNSTELKNLKSSLDNDIFPKACARCKESEKIQARSRRQYLLSQTDIENNEYFLDLNFGNTCNLKCRMCGPEHSSLWHKEIKKIDKDKNVQNLFRKDYSPYTISNNDINKIVDFMEKTNGTFTIELKGGEPLIMDSTEKFFDLLYKKNLIKNIKNLDICTNGTRKKPDWFEKIINDIMSVTITASIDGKDEIFEIIRGNKFISYKEVLENFATFDNENINKNINIVVQNYNIHHVPELYKDLKKITSQINLIILLGPAHLKANVMPRKSRLKILDYYKSNYVKNILGHDKNYHSILKILQEPCSKKKLNDFYTFNNTLDKLRNQNVKEIIPHLFV